MDSKGIRLSGNVFKDISVRRMSSNLQNYWDIDILLDNRLKAHENSLLKLKESNSRPKMPSDAPKDRVFADNHIKLD